MYRTKDLQKGKMYAFVYRGNKCVANVTDILTGSVYCRFAVGLWNDEESFIEHDKNHVAVDVNLRDYDIQGFELASQEEYNRYVTYVTEYNRNDKGVGVKIVGKIDLSTIPNSTRPVVKPKEWSVKEGFKNLDVKNFCYYEDEEIVAFKRGERTGIAIGMVDEVFQKVGFYAAMNLYGNPNQLVKMGDEVDGKVIDGWDDDCIIMKADQLTKDTGGVFLKNMYKSEIDAYHKMQEEELARREEEERLAKEKAEQERFQQEARKQEAIERLRQERERLSKESNEDELPIYDDLRHLPYMRSEKKLLDREYPKVALDVSDSVGLRGLACMANLIRDMIFKDKINGIPNHTYLLSSHYYDEMMRRKDSYTEVFRTFNDIVGDDVWKHGTLVYTNKVGQRCALIFCLNTSKTNAVLRYAYMADDMLLCTQQINTGISMDENKTQTSNLFSPLEYNKKQRSGAMHDAYNVVFSFLCMENDAESIINKMTNGGSASYKASLLVEGDPDIEVRDASWFTNVFVNKTIEVESYKSHRWFGSGDDKHLEEVTVRGYTKSGYTIQAKVR